MTALLSPIAATVSSQSVMTTTVRVQPAAESWTLLDFLTGAQQSVIFLLPWASAYYVQAVLALLSACTGLLVTTNMFSRQPVGLVMQPLGLAVKVSLY